jgi:predicted RND superfamily exporter protein
VHGLIAILPVAFSVIIVFAVLVITGTPLGIANSMFASIAIGIGLDFSIHLTAAYQLGRARGALPVDSMRKAFVETGSSILVSAGAITLGFLVLALSEVAPNVQLGLMICLSLTVCAVTTLVLVPSLALIRRFTRCA